MSRAAARGAGARGRVAVRRAALRCRSFVRCLLSLYNWRRSPNSSLADARARRGGLSPAGGAAPGSPPRPLLPDARLAPRRRGRAPGDAAPRLAGAAAPGGPEQPLRLAVQDRDERLPGRARLAPQADAAGRSRPHGPPRRGSRAAAGRVGVGGAVPGRATRHRGRPRGLGGALRAARGGRARVHRRAAASAARPARGAGPAGRARLLGARDRRGARHDRPRGEQCAPARPQGGAGPAPGAEPAAHRARARRPARA
jgi:hypothetical protein